MAAISGASAEMGEPDHSGTGGAVRSLWWKWTAPTAGPVRIEAMGAGLDTVLAVYTGTALGNLSLAARNDDAGLSTGSCVTLWATAGQEFQIAVNERTGTDEPVTLMISQRHDALVYAGDFSALGTGAGSLAGRQSWQSLFAESASGTVEVAGIRRGFLSASGVSGSVGGLWLPINYSGANDTSDRVMISSTWTLSASATATAASEAFMFLIYSQGGGFLAGLEFDLSSGNIRRLDGQSSHNTGASFQKGVDARLEVQVNPVGNRWTVRFGDTVLFDNAVFSLATDSSLPLGSVGLAWTTDMASVASDAQLLFTDVEIRDASDRNARQSSPEPSAGAGMAIATPVSSARGVGFSWTAVPGAVGYEVWRGTSTFNSATRVGVTDGAVWTDLELPTAATYTYWVRAVDEQGAVFSSGTVSVPWSAVKPRLVNISSRGTVRPTQPMVAGFVIEGISSRRVLVRAIGPSLADFGLSDVLEQPAVRLFAGPNRTKIAESNQPWAATAGASEIVAATERAGAFAIDPSSGDVAFVMDLAPGEYTAEVAGGVGNCLVEIYSVDDVSAGESSRLLNLSTRGFSGAGAEALIAGFVVSEDKPKRILIRGIGPSLAAYGVAGPMQDPAIRVFAVDDDIPLQENDNWAGTTALEDAFRSAGAFLLEAQSRDAALVVDLPPGAYTVVLAPARGDGGDALLEIYEMPDSL